MAFQRRISRMVTVWCCLAGVVLVTGPTAGQEEPMGNPPQTEVVKETQTLSLIHISEPTRPY